MPVISLIITVIATTVQGAFKKKLNEKCSEGEFATSALITFFALLFFIIFSGQSTFSAEILPYCAFYSLCYACAAATYIFALTCGSLALTQLVLSYSCIIPLVYSLFCGESLGLFRIIGVVFLFLSIIVTYYKKEKSEGETLSPKWLITVILMFFSNGMCSVITRMQQLAFGGIYDNAFMLVSLIFATAILLTLALIREKRKMLSVIKRGTLLSLACGVSNGLANYFTLICLATIPNAVFFPVKSAGGLVLTGVMSVLIFKEKLRGIQYVGILLGVFAMIFINIP